MAKKDDKVEVVETKKNELVADEQDLVVESLNDQNSIKKIKKKLHPKVEAEVKPKKAVKVKEIVKEVQLCDIPGVGPGTIDKLMGCGLVDVASVAVANVKYLSDTIGISASAARKLQSEANKLFNLDFMTVFEVEEKDSKKKCISLGASAFNDMMGGGIETQTITEFAGQYGAGKTQIAHVLATQCVMQNPNDYVVWIDTETTFKPSRIDDIAKANDMDPQKIKEKILVLRVNNSDIQMFAVLRKLPELIAKNMKVRLIIIDSITAQFRAEFAGRGTLADRQQKLNGHIRDLKNFADKYNTAIFVTNQVMSDPANMFGPPNKPIGGNIMGHGAHVRVFLRSGKAGTRVAKLYDSSHLPDGECQYEIVEGGIQDVK